MFKIRVERAWNRNGYNLWILKYEGQRGMVAAPLELKMEELKNGWQLPAPTLELNSGPFGDAEDFLRSLVEGVMEAGLVPMVSKDNAKQEEALKENLKDLRKITDVLLTK